MRLTIGRKIGGGFLFTILLFSLLGWESLRATEKVTETNEWVAHTYNVLETLERALSVLKDVGGRGFVMTGDEEYLQPYRAAKVALPQNLKALRDLTHDNAAQQRRCDHLDEIVAARLEIVEAIVHARKEKGVDAASELLPKSKRLLDEGRRLIAEMEVEERQLLERRKVDAAEALQTTKVMFAIGSLCTIAASLLVAAWISRGITRAIGRLVDGARRVGAGALDQTVEVRSRDEVGDLTIAFNEMTQQLQSRPAAAPPKP